MIAITDICVCPQCFMVSEGPLLAGGKCEVCGHVFSAEDQKKSEADDALIAAEESVSE